MPADRSTATLWNHAAGQVTISAAPQSSVTVTAWDGSTADCYQNAFGILPFYQHGGSYPATAINPSGNTSSGDLCMAVGVVKPGTAADGFTQNGNGFDAPANDGDWPNSVTGPPPYVNVWLR